MIKGQQEIMISKYIELYDLLVPKDNFLRQINDSNFAHEKHQQTT